MLPADDFGKRDLRNLNSFSPFGMPLSSSVKEKGRGAFFDPEISADSIERLSSVSLIAILEQSPPLVPEGSPPLPFHPRFFAVGFILTLGTLELPEEATIFIMDIGI